MAATATITRLTISLFDRPRFTSALGEGSFPPRPGTRALFVALAFAARPLRRDWLASALWPDVTDVVARANLRRHVSYVEQWLKPLTGCDTPILRIGGMLALEPALIEWIDVRAFEEAVANAAFEDATQIYTGDLLVDLDDEWIAVERRRLRARYDEALFSLVAGARARNEPEAALRYARAARAIDPYDESWLRATMRVRYAAGDRAGALREYELYRTLIETDLDIEPMPETFMLADSMRRLEAGAVTAPLPFESTSFIGRERELAQLGELIARERLVTVSGEPGVGKSRLLLNCVRSLASRYRNGVAIVDAGSSTDAQAVERSIVRGLARSGATPAGDSIEEAAAGLEVIVLLDGCERVADACADLARRLLESNPQIRVVTSSRVPLGIAHEAVFRLWPLQSSEAAALFFERLRVARPTSVLSAADTPSVERICRRLEGLPLAIELAAARARVSTLAQIEDDVGNVSERAGPGLLHATYESSYALLDPTESAVLRRLAAFSSGWTVSNALAACRDLSKESEVLAAFTTLVEHSLVVPPGVTEVGARYSMLDATRDFALYRARALGEIESDARAHAFAIARHYVAIGRRLRAERAAESYREIEPDRENIETALTTLWRGDAGDRSLATDLSLAVSRFWADQGFARAGERWLRRSLVDLAEEDTAKRLELLRVIGTLTRDLGDYESSFRDFTELVRLLEAACASPVEIAKAQTMAANAARMMADFEEALSRTRFAYAAFAGSGEAYLAAWATYALGTTLLSAGRFAEAAVELERATAAFNEVGAVSDSSSSIANLSLCHYYQGQLGIAHELARESLARAQAVGHRYYYAHAALNEALIVTALGEPGRAWPMILEAIAIGRDLAAIDVTISCAEAACAVLAQTQAEDAAILLGSIDNARERARAPRFPVDRPSYDDVSAKLRRVLGDERFEALRIRGRVTLLRDAVGRLGALPIPVFEGTA